MHFLRRAISGIVLAAVSLALLLWAGVSLSRAIQEAAERAAPNIERAEEAIAVRAMPIFAGTHRPELTLPGELRARKALELRARASGLVVYVAPEVEEGGAVRAGQLLLRTNPAAASAALKSAQVDLQEAQQEEQAALEAVELAGLDLAAAQRQAALQEQSFQRQQDLQSRGVGSSSAVEASELAVASANQAVVARRLSAAQSDTRVNQAAARLARASVALSEAERALADTEIHAAFDGVLANVSVVDGGLVAVNERLAQLVDPVDLEVALRLSTIQYSRLLDDAGKLLSLPLLVSLESGGLTLRTDARLDRAAALVEAGQTGRQVFATLTQSAGFRAGDLVRVRIPEPELEQVAKLPASAVSAENTVLRISAENRLVETPVSVLRRQGDNIYIDAQGLENSQIVSVLTPLLGPGVLVVPSDLESTVQGGASASEDMLRLSPERRARLIAFVENSDSMTSEAKSRALAQLAAEEVPAGMVARLERRMGS
ncbi:MAG: efflux transporter periplasmic adaptor subunit [Mangrovicoccus sp.]|nr:efflux transporter periplasmic adaptor subunit [Mangrovicoccus sp.]